MLGVFLLVVLLGGGGGCFVVVVFCNAKRTPCVMPDPVATYK